MWESCFLVFCFWLTKVNRLTPPSSVHYASNSLWCFISSHSRDSFRHFFFFLSVLKNKFSCWKHKRVKTTGNEETLQNKLHKLVCVMDLSTLQDFDPSQYLCWTSILNRNSRERAIYSNSYEECLSYDDVSVEGKDSSTWLQAQNERKTWCQSSRLLRQLIYGLTFWKYLGLITSLAFLRIPNVIVVMSATSQKTRLGKMERHIKYSLARSQMEVLSSSVRTPAVFISDDHSISCDWICWKEKTLIIRVLTSKINRLAEQKAKELKRE
jgi:hypothetical protein